MCGVFAYIGSSNNASDIVFDGLKMLEYRGYDSWGIASITEDKILIKKAVGKLQVKPKLFNSTIAIGHNRWATHGEVSEVNAHPHTSTDKLFTIVQNGIVENYLELKKELIENGYKFNTQTDTEVIVKLIEKELNYTDSLHEAIRNTYKKIKGRNTVIVLSSSGDLYAVKNGSPLIIGFSKENEIYIASDTNSLVNKVRDIVALDNMQMFAYVKNEQAIFDVVTGIKLEVKKDKLKLSKENASLGKFKYYMEKEIYDTPSALTKIAKLDDIAITQLAKKINEAKTVYIIGSGTTGIAAAQMAYYLRKITKINAISLIGADCKEYWEMLSSKDLIIALSQSGETADVTEVLEIAKEKKVTIASLVNMQGSMISRMSDIKFMNDAGPEICVMSTKVFTTQIAWGYLIAMATVSKLSEGKQDILSCANIFSEQLKDKYWIENIKKTASKLASSKDIIIFGKGELFNIAKEGMVKIIEGASIHAHAIPAGDLKHYAITLIEPGFTVIGLVSEDSTKEDLISALSQVKARGANITGLALENSELFDNYIKLPDSGKLLSLVAILPLQLLAYYITLYLGHDVDKPRNIAKCVTVK